MLQALGPIFLALNQALKIWDFYNQTKYQRRYEDIITQIGDELAKPIYDGNLQMDELRDQNKIDRLYLQLKILLEKFLNENKDKTKFH